MRAATGVGEDEVLFVVAALAEGDPLAVGVRAAVEVARLEGALVEDPAITLTAGLVRCRRLPALFPEIAVFEAMVPDSLPPARPTESRWKGLP